MLKHLKSCLQYDKEDLDMEDELESVSSKSLSVRAHYTSPKKRYDYKYITKIKKEMDLPYIEKRTKKRSQYHDFLKEKSVKLQKKKQKKQEILARQHFRLYGSQRDNSNYSSVIPKTVASRYSKHTKHKSNSKYYLTRKKTTSVFEKSHIANLKLYSSAGGSTILTQTPDNLDYNWNKKKARLLLMKKRQKSKSRLSQHLNQGNYPIGQSQLGRFTPDPQMMSTQGSSKGFGLKFGGFRPPKPQSKRGYLSSYLEQQTDVPLHQCDHHEECKKNCESISEKKIYQDLKSTFKWEDENIYNENVVKGKMRFEKCKCVHEDDESGEDGISEEYRKQFSMTCTFGFQNYSRNRFKKKSKYLKRTKQKRSHIPKSLSPEPSNFELSSSKKVKKRKIKLKRSKTQYTSPLKSPKHSSHIHKDGHNHQHQNKSEPQKHTGLRYRGSGIKKRKNKTDVKQDLTVPKSNSSNKSNKSGRSKFTTKGSRPPSPNLPIHKVVTFANDGNNKHVGNPMKMKVSRSKSLNSYEQVDESQLKNFRDSLKPHQQQNKTGQGQMKKKRKQSESKKQLMQKWMMIQMNRDLRDYKNGILPDGWNEENINVVKKLKKMNRKLVNELYNLRSVNAINVLCDYIDFAVFIDDIDLLIECIKMVAIAYLDFDNLANAFFAFNQMKKLCHITAKYNKQIEAYLGICECLMRNKDYKLCITLLKKAIQYAWYCDDLEKEMVIYDKFGLVFFNLKDMDKANRYHTRMIHTFPEPKDKSTLRKTQCEYVRKEIRGMKIYDTICSKMLQQLKVQVLKKFINIPNKKFEKGIQSQCDLVENILYSKDQNTWEITKTDFIENTSPNFFTKLKMTQQSKELFRSVEFCNLELRDGKGQFQLDPQEAAEFVMFKNKSDYISSDEKEKKPRLKYIRKVKKQFIIGANGKRTEIGKSTKRETNISNLRFSDQFINQPFSMEIAQEEHKKRQEVLKQKFLKTLNWKLSKQDVFLNHRTPGRTLYDYKNKGLNIKKYQEFCTEVLIKYLKDKPALKPILALIRKRDREELEKIQKLKLKDEENDKKKRLMSTNIQF